MTYGMRTKGGDGAVQLDESSFTCRVVYSAVVNPATAPNGSYFDIPVVGVTTANAAAFCIPAGPINFSSDKQLEPEIINGAARVWRVMKGYSYPNSWSSQTAMILIVVRFK
jgi:hypothetical protein